MQPFDIEVYPNYFLIAIGSDQFEMVGVGTTATVHKRRALLTILGRGVYGFNSLNFDAPLIMAYLAGFSCDRLYHMAQDIIQNGLKYWETYRKYQLHMPEFDHIDLMGIPRGIASLKAYGARMHAPKLQDLPFDPHEPVTPDQIRELRKYCQNDIDTTRLLYETLADQLEVRRDLTELYSIDCRSKSDAQIAEAVIKAELTKKGHAPRKPGKHKGYFYYTPPAHIKFETPEMQQVLKDLIDHRFELDKSGKVIKTDALDRIVNLNGVPYKMGIGGLHSMEKRQRVVSDDQHLLVDRDVASYYPASILNCEIFPPHLGRIFSEVYRGLVERRLAAKARGDHKLSAVLKIVVNSTFGKLLSKYSFLYDPSGFIKVTITGQLSLLMLIERLGKLGHEVVSANTDGFVTRVHKDQYDGFDFECDLWEAETGYDLEETRYTFLCSRDVNNYLAQTAEGKVKGKGVFAESGLSKNPTGSIIYDAVKANLTDGVPIETTINTCQTLEPFITTRTVKGGGQWCDQPLGKVVRWYNSKEGSPIRYVTNGNQVAGTKHAIPVMDLPDVLPDNIDRAWYINEAKKLLKAIGA